MGSIEMHKLNTSENNTSSVMKFLTRTHAGATAVRMTIDETGLVGIGSADPAATLHIRRDGNDRTIGFSEGNDTPTYTMGVDHTDSKFKIHSANGLANTSDFTIDTSGNVGIGTSAPGSLLDIQGGDTCDVVVTCFDSDSNTTNPTVTLRKSSNNTIGQMAANSHQEELGAIVFQGVKSDNSAYATAAYIQGTQELAAGATYVGGELGFFTGTNAAAPVERMTIQDDGYVGIGNTAPDRQFCVRSTLNGAVALIETNHATITSSATLLDLKFSGDDDCTGAYFIRYLDSGHLVGSVTATNGTTATHNNSDYRLKENITPISGSLEKINKLKPVNFNYKSHPNGSHEGFVAHEVQEAGLGYAIMGEKDATKVDEDGTTVDDIQTIAITNLIPQMVKAIQELSAKVDELTNKQGDNNVKTNSENGDSESNGDSSETSNNGNGPGSENQGTGESVSSDSNESNSDSGSSSSNSTNESSTSGTPSKEWTKDKLKEYMTDNAIAFNSGDTKDDLLNKIEGAK